MALWRIRATVDDRPGYLSVLTASLALRSVNILSVQVNASEVGAIDDFLVDAPDSMTRDDLYAAIAKGRGRDAWVAPTSAYGLVDGPTHLLSLAARLIREPHELDGALATLLGDCSVRWRPDEVPTWQGFTDTAMALPDPSGGTLYLDRDSPSFTPVEYARAHALVELASMVSERVGQRWQLLLPGGQELTLRRLADEDAADVVAMGERCDRVGYAAWRRALVDDTADGASDGPVTVDEFVEMMGSGVVMGVITEAGEVVGCGALRWDGPDAAVALLVEDAWRRRGLGTAIVRRLVQNAAITGFATVFLPCEGENEPLRRTVARLGYPTSEELKGEHPHLRLDLNPDIARGHAGVVTAPGAS